MLSNFQEIDKIFCTISQWEFQSPPSAARSCFKRDIVFKNCVFKIRNSDALAQFSLYFVKSSFSDLCFQLFQVLTYLILHLYSIALLAKVLHFRKNHTTWEVSKYGVISGPYFPVFGLNTETYSVSLLVKQCCCTSILDSI